MNDPEVLQLLPTGTKSPRDDGSEPANPPWYRELPSESDFSSAIQGSGPADTALRQRAALAVLISVIHGLANQFERELDRIRPRGVLARFVLMRRALDKQGLYSASDLTSMSAEAIARRKAIRESVLKAFFSKGSIAAYRATPDYLASEEEYPVPPWVGTDVSKARSEHTDLSLFGLQLGQPLRLPACSGGGGETCVGDFRGKVMGGQGGVFEGLLGALSGLPPLAGDAAAIKGAQQVGVGLAANRCPDWVDPCAIAATVIDGVMLGATLSVGTKTKEALADLQRKYGQADGSRPVRCTYETHSTAMASNGVTVSVATGSRTLEGRALSWSKVPGIYVSYVPFGGTDCQSRVYVELASVRALAASASARAEATKPRM